MFFKLKKLKRRLRRLAQKNIGTEFAGQAECVKKKIIETFSKDGSYINPFSKEDVKEKIKKTMLERYGVEHPLQNKELMKKSQETCRSHYGVENPLQSNEIKEKLIQTSLKKYGTKYPNQNEEVRHKVIDTTIKNWGGIGRASFELNEKFETSCLRKFGVRNPLKSSDVKQKIKETNFKRFGAKTFAESEIAKKLVYEKLFADEFVVPLFTFEEYLEHFDERYEYEWEWKCRKCGHKFKQNFRKSAFKLNDNDIIKVRCRKCYPLLSCFSKKEKEVVAFIKSIYSGTVLENCYKVLEPNEQNGWKANHELDIYMPELNLAVEFNGDYFHNYELFPEAKINDDFKKIQCEEKNIKLIIIWEHDWMKRRKDVENLLYEEINK